MDKHIIPLKASLFKTLNLVGITLILSVLLITNIQAAIAESDGGPEDIVEKSLELWNTGNMALADELYTSDFKFHLVDQVKPEIVGIEVLKGYVDFLRTAYPDLKYTSEEMIVSGDKVIMLMNFSGTNTGPRGGMPPTGKTVEVSSVMISRIDEGKIAESWAYTNMASVYRQLGFTLTPPSEQK